MLHTNVAAVVQHGADYYNSQREVTCVDDGGGMACTGQSRLSLWGGAGYLGLLLVAPPRPGWSPSAVATCPRRRAIRAPRGRGVQLGNVTQAPAPGNRKLLRLEVRNAETPDRAQAGVDQDPGEDGSGVHRAAEPGEVRGPAHGLPGGRLPQHLRVLGGPRGDLPHRRRPVHPALRLLPDRHRQAAAAGPRRAPPGGRVGAEDAAALRHHHRRRPRRPRRRRCLAVRRDRARDPRAQPRHRASRT